MPETVETVETVCLCSRSQFELVIIPLFKSMASASNGQDPITDGKLWPTAKPRTCDKCGESYPSIIKFNAHRATCKKLKCSKCVLRFATRQELKAHAETHCVRFQCDECETKPFSSQGQLENHKKLAHDHVIKCPHCDATFCRVDKRDSHVKAKHTAETANKCACGATYVKKCQLESHEKQCVASPLGAANAVKRKFEELVESSLSQGEGDEAGMNVASFAVEAFDTVREAAQQKQKGEQRVCCTTCGTPYGNLESLKRHMRKKHPRASGSGNEGGA